MRQVVVQQRAAAGGFRAVRRPRALPDEACAFASLTPAWLERICSVYVSRQIYRASLQESSIAGMSLLFRLKLGP